MSNHRRIVIGNSGLSAAAVASVRLWLRADLGITQVSGNVSRWDDQSGSGNGCTGSGATLITGQGGRPAIKFNYNGSLTSSTNVVPAGSARTLFVVTRTGLQGDANAVGGDLLFQFKTASPYFKVVHARAGGLAAFTYQGSGTTVYSSPVGDISIPVIKEVTWDGNTLHDIGVRVNGQDQVITHGVAGSGTYTDTGTAGYIVGGPTVIPPPPAGNSFQEISEIVAFDTVLADADSAKIRTLFSNWYSIPLIVS